MSEALKNDITYMMALAEDDSRQPIHGGGRRVADAFDLEAMRRLIDAG